MSKIFVANPQKGLKCRDISDVNLLNFEWTDGKLKIRDMSNWKYYDIKYLEINGDTYLKPVKGYNCYNFESTFNFDCYCEGFTTDKIIRIDGFELE